MVKDCLTKKQKERWLRTVEAYFYRKYEEALKSGAISEEDVSLKSDYTLARCVLMITAKAFEPLSDVGKEMLENLSKFI